MAEARRYLLNRVLVSTSGVTTVSAVTTFNLTDGFDGARLDDTLFSYDPITLTDLSKLKEEDYTQRVSDFIIFVGVESEINRNNLINQSAFTDPSCE